jgi:hypothetical protein
VSVINAGDFQGSESAVKLRNLISSNSGPLHHGKRPVIAPSPLAALGTKRPSQLSPTARAPTGAAPETV